ncbi:MAG TPA: hypothetical protein GXX18_07120 [Bacillales bacterium]|nr:hypothetical protein [Bacillales bacterium]
MSVVVVSVLIILQVWLFKILNVLKQEIYNLRGVNLAIEIKHPAIGMNINELLKKDEIPSKKQGIYIFTLPHCSACYSQIEQVISLMKTSTHIPPVSVIIPEEEEFLKEEFLSKYSEVINIRFTTFDILAGNLDFPSILTVDKEGLVKEIYKNIEYSFRFYKEAFL